MSDIQRKWDEEEYPKVQSAQFNMQGRELESVHLGLNTMFASINAEFAALEERLAAVEDWIATHPGPPQAAPQSEGEATGG
jgi:hypothetical protein